MTVPGADPAVVGPYLARVLDEPAWAGCAVEVIAGGRSNLTYAVSSPAGTLVLRRPPLRAVRPTAHDMTREHRVLSALVGTAVPVPRPLHLCTDPDVLGAPFYVMQRVDGVIARGSLPPGYADTPAERVGDDRTRWSTCWPTCTRSTRPRSGWPASAGRTATWPGSCAAGWGSGRRCGTPTCPAVDALAAELADAAAGRRRAARSCTATTGWTTSCSTRPTRAGWPRCWTGRCPPSATRSPTSACCSSTGSRAGPADAPVVTPSVTGAARLPRPAATWWPGTPAAPGGTSRRCPGTSAFGFFKLAVVVAGIVARHRAGAMADNTDDGLARVIEPLADSGRAALSRPDLDLMAIRPSTITRDGRRSGSYPQSHGDRAQCGGNGSRGRSSAPWRR